MEALIGAAHCTMSSLSFSLLPQSVNHTAQGNRSQMVTHLPALCTCECLQAYVYLFKCLNAWAYQALCVNLCVYLSRSSYIYTVLSVCYCINIMKISHVLKRPNDTNTAQIWNFMSNISQFTKVERKHAFYMIEMARDERDISVQYVCFLLYLHNLIFILYT